MYLLLPEYPGQTICSAWKKGNVLFGTAKYKQIWGYLSCIYKAYRAKFTSIQEAFSAQDITWSQHYNHFCFQES